MERRIEIFISGSTDPNISQEYREAAEAFGKMLNVEKHNVIFDGCKGLPGVVAAQMKQPNDNLSIAMPSYHAIADKDWIGARINGQFRYQSEVTRALLDWADVAVFFKGGIGTLAELSHAIDTKKNKEHNKPILIMNIQHQWEDLIRILKPLKLDDLYEVIESPQAAMDYIERNVKINPRTQMVQTSTKVREEEER